MTNASDTSSRDWRDMFVIPPVIKQVFAKFPLSTYTANALPTRSPTHRDQHSLYTWTTPQEDANSAHTPSFNPTCLKWQTYLLFNDIAFRALPSNNHASPSGSLPFLLPANSQKPIASAKLENWTATHSTSKSAAGSGASTTQSSARQEVYTSLLDHAVRRAWLYLLYLCPDNFSHVAQRLYVSSSSSNTFVAMAISYQLKDAATQELVKITPVVKAEDILQEAVDAFRALETVLGEEDWFFGAKGPGLFDASVFAYTHLLLDDGMGWRINPLTEKLAGLHNLVGHRNRILEKYYRR